MLDWKKVDEALRLVDRAIDSVEFGNWVERRREDLDCDYDSYQMGCHKDLEEPDSFYVWALGLFLQRKLVKA